jgi:hypothetical protein
MALNTLPNEGLTNRGYPSDRIVTPIIINGDMSVAQRGTSFTSASGYTLDRFQFNNNSLGVWTVSQSTTVPTGQGFATSFKADCTTADASPASGDFLFLIQKIEGQNLQMIKKGTSSAEKLTVSFWVRSNKTGTYICELQDMDNSRTCSQAYTISSADTWEKKVLNFPADTTGVFDNDNANSLQVNLYLASGTDRTSGTLATTFVSTTNANRAVGQVNLADSTSNEWYITGLQMEVGEFDSTSIPAFPFESFANNFIKCQRYCQVFKTENAYGMMSPASVNSSTVANGIFTFPTYFRAIPSLSTSGSFGLYSGDGGDAVSSVVIDANSDDPSRLVCTISGSGFTDNSAAFFRAENDSSAKMTFDAEL